MSGRQGFVSNGQTYVYQESPTTGSAAFGLDSADGDTWKLKVLPTDAAIPSATPQMEIDPVTNGSIYFTPNGTGVVNLDNDTASTSANSAVLRKTRSLGVITSGDTLGSISFQGIGTGTTFTEGASIRSTNSGTVGANRVAGNLVFSTHPDSASGATATIRMTIAPTGEITIPAPDSGNTLTLSAFSAGALVSSSAGVITSTAPSTAGFVLTSNGAGVIPTFQSSSGGVTSITGTANQITASSSTGAVTLSTPSTFIAPGSIASTTTITAATGFTATAGGLTVTAGNIVLPTANAAGTSGVMTIGASYKFYTRGGANNIFLGDGTNLALIGSTDQDNVGIGIGSLNNFVNNTATKNVAIGNGTLASVFNSAGNTALGYQAGNIISGNFTTSLGYQALATLQNFVDYTVGIGYQAGSATTGNVTSASNIYINSPGIGGGESNTLRIGAGSGTGNQQLSQAFISGIASVTVANTNMVTINTTTGQLGSAAVPTGAFPWAVTTVDANMVANNGYIANKAGLLTMTLPAAAAVGDMFRITGINNATGWKIGQVAGQTIHFAGVNTTTGTGGSLASTATRDTVELVCVVANTDFNILSSIGNITIV